MTRLASEIREADRPIYCSACFNSQPVRHVDFDAACDRGYGNEASVAIAMDDLVLCEHCVREGARLLGIEDSITLKADVRDLTVKLEDAEKRAEKAERYASVMEDAVNLKGVEIDHRRKPRRTRDEVAA